MTSVVSTKYYVLDDSSRDLLLSMSVGKGQISSSTIRLNTATIETGGIFGINIHRASEYQESLFVNKWSAGCQVFARPDEYAEFMRLCKLAVAEWGNSFTYTLMRFDQLHPH